MLLDLTTSMTKKYLIDKLIAIWFTENESKIYVSCLEMWVSTASQISKSSKLNRITAYDTLEKLLKKWYLTSNTSKWVKNFSVLDPEIIIDEKIWKINALKKMVPFMLSLKTDNAVCQTFRQYEWIDWVKKAFKEAIKTSWTIYLITNPTTLIKHWPEYVEEFDNVRIREQIRLKRIAPDDIQWLLLKANDISSLSETKLISEEAYPISCEILICSNFVLVSSLEWEQFAYVINSKSVSSTYLSMFNLLWNSLR